MAADSAKAVNADPPLQSGIEAGRQRFEMNCAICHGLDARGNGPFAELLNVKPPDLTLLSRAQGGDFPFSRVYRRIDGRDLPLAHGTRDMPIWGRRLKREGGDETYVRGRLFEIMLYLESLQQI
ncbi:MAG: c-type cytochrome [Proteobacteria bacterium]|nr:c-type cytochrome [Pseudomonadota bacterium]MBK8957443.1 c-type cytochrome [Pseudomonadota bacterium]